MNFTIQQSYHWGYTRDIFNPVYANDFSSLLWGTCGAGVTVHMVHVCGSGVLF